jgi:hypothetical protein
MRLRSVTSSYTPTHPPSVRGGRDDPAVDQFAQAELSDILVAGRIAGDFVGRSFFLDPVLDDLLVRRSRLGKFLGHAEHFHKPCIANDQSHVAVIHAKTVGHVVQSNIKLGVELFELGLAIQDLALRTLALGDVLMGRYPAAVGHRRDGDGDHAAIWQFAHDRRAEPAPGMISHDVFDIIGRVG